MSNENGQLLVWPDEDGSKELGTSSSLDQPYGEGK